MVWSPGAGIFSKSRSGAMHFCSDRRQENKASLSRHCACVHLSCPCARARSTAMKNLLRDLCERRGAARMLRRRACRSQSGALRAPAWARLPAVLRDAGQADGRAPGGARRPRQGDGDLFGHGHADRNHRCAALGQCRRGRHRPAGLSHHVGQDARRHERARHRGDEPPAGLSHDAQSRISNRSAISPRTTASRCLRRKCRCRRSCCR